MHLSGRELFSHAPLAPHWFAFDVHLFRDVKSTLSSVCGRCYENRAIAKM